MPACHLRHDRARRKQFRDDPPLVRVTPPSPATNATANLDAPSRRGSVNYMVDHICEPMPSTGSHLPNYAARCKMGAKTPLTDQHQAGATDGSRNGFRNANQPLWTQDRCRSRDLAQPHVAHANGALHQSRSAHSRMMPRNVLERN